MLDLPGSVVVSTMMGTRDGADIILDGGSRIKVPEHLIQGARRTNQGPAPLLHVGSIENRLPPGHAARSCTFAFSADQFLDGKHTGSGDGAVRRRAEL